MRSTTRTKLANIVNTCIILRNMFIKEDGNAIAPVHIMDHSVAPVLDDEVLRELRNEQMCFQVAI
jgi:hypothetical protein